MALDPKPLYSFHEEVENTLRKWKNSSGFNRAELQYGFNPKPHVELTFGKDVVNITLPESPRPYHDWKSYFQDYIEDQIALVSQEMGVDVVVVGSKRSRLPLSRKESLEEPI